MTISTSRLHIHIYLCKYRIWLHDDHDDESITSGFLLMKSDNNKIYVTTMPKYIWPTLLNGSTCTTTEFLNKISTNEYTWCLHKMSPYSRFGGQVVRYIYYKG